MTLLKLLCFLLSVWPFYKWHIFYTRRWKWPSSSAWQLQTHPPDLQSHCVRFQRRQASHQQCFLSYALSPFKCFSTFETFKPLVFLYLESVIGQKLSRKLIVVTRWSVHLQQLLCYTLWFIDYLNQLMDEWFILWRFLSARISPYSLWLNLIARSLFLGRIPKSICKGQCLGILTDTI